MALKQIKNRLLYGWATCAEKNNGNILVNLRVKDQMASTKDKVVFNSHKFVYDSQTFFSFLPKTVTNLGDANKKYAAAISEDGSKIFQFKPYNEDSMIVRFRGFYRDNKGDVVINPGFADKRHLTAIFELEVAQGPWTGTVYSYRYWNINDKESYEPIFEVKNGDITFKWLTKPMRTILEASGVMERNFKSTLPDTDDPQQILTELEEQILLDKSVRLSIGIKDGYPDWKNVFVLGQDDDIEDEFFVADDEDTENENVVTVAPSSPSPSPKTQSKAFDDGEEEDDE